MCTLHGQVSHLRDRAALRLCGGWQCTPSPASTHCASAWLLAAGLARLGVKLYSSPRPLPGQRGLPYLIPCYANGANSLLSERTTSCANPAPSRLGGSGQIETIPPVAEGGEQSMRVNWRIIIQREMAMFNRHRFEVRSRIHVIFLPKRRRIDTVPANHF